MDIIIGPTSSSRQAAVKVCNFADDLNGATARMVVASPAHYSVQIQRAACFWLFQNGDWQDHRRARALMATILRDWDKAEQARIESKVVRAGKWVLAGFLAVALGIVTGKAAEKVIHAYAQEAAFTADRSVP